jgi:hypothetical protein
VTDRSAEAFTNDYELPDVFIWGRDGADKFRQAVFSELTRSGIDPVVFADESGASRIRGLGSHGPLPPDI